MRSASFPLSYVLHPQQAGPVFAGKGLLRRWQETALQANYPNATPDDVDYLVKQSNRAAWKIGGVSGGMMAGMVGLAQMLRTAMPQNKQAIRRFMKKPLVLPLLTLSITSILLGVVTQQFRKIFKERPHLFHENPALQQKLAEMPLPAQILMRLMYPELKNGVNAA